MSLIPRRLTEFPRRFSERFLDMPLSEFPELWQDFETEIKGLSSELTMYEDKNNNFVVEAELPGFNREEIKVKIYRGVLWIKAEKKEDESNKDKRFLQKSSHYMTRTYRIPLPEQVDEKQAIKAIYKDGIITIHCQKSKAGEAQEVQVQLGE